MTSKHTPLSPESNSIIWADPAREQAFFTWLKPLLHAQNLQPESLHLASADASFRRYFRIYADDGHPRIIMDAPPDLENTSTFVRIAQNLKQVGLKVPDVLAWDKTLGFLLLSDLGTTTMLQGMNSSSFAPNTNLYKEANTVLLHLQSAAPSTDLPHYDHARLSQELQLFPKWYVAKHRQITLSAEEKTSLHSVFETIIANNLAAPKCFVHRDFMPRNLILPYPNEHGLGLLDFQDALHGPITYDIASLMRDAFHSWDEEHVLDVTVRYWEKARLTGRLDFEDWHSDFGAFWRAIDWMALQRHLKIAGIFARLGLRDHKPNYLADTPRFIGYIRSTCARYRELGPLLRLLDRIEGTQAEGSFSFGRMPSSHL